MRPPVRPPARLGRDAQYRALDRLASTDGRHVPTSWGQGEAGRRMNHPKPAGLALAPRPRNERRPQTERKGARRRLPFRAAARARQPTRQAAGVGSDETGAGAGAAASSAAAFIDRRRRPLSSASMHLDADDLAFLQVIGDLVDALLGDLRDVQQAVLAGQHLHDRAEVEQAQHRAFVDAADLDFRGDVLDALARDVARVGVDRRDGDRAVVLDVDRACRSPRSARGSPRRPCRSRRGSSPG